MDKSFTFEINKHTEPMFGESFWIPQSLERLYIEVGTEEDCGPAGYIILKDEGGHIRLQKLIGYGSPLICIGRGPCDTSIGGVPSSVGAGRWELIIYIFTEYVKQRPGDGACTLTVRLADTAEGDAPRPDYTGRYCWVSGRGEGELFHDMYDWNKVFRREQRWYKGDFHTHTRLSDGRETVENAMKKAADMDLDFYVPTEHNVIHTGWVETEVMAVPGIEVTTEQGHCNLFGIDRMPEALPRILAHMGGTHTGAYMKEVWEEARKRGWGISINHPFLHIWKWKYEETPLGQIDFLEIVNDPTYTYAGKSNWKAIRFLDWLWQDGYKIYGIGGSDSHNLITEYYEGAREPSVAGDPGTYVFTEELSPENMLRAMKKGHVYVSRHCSLELNICAGGVSYLPGDEIVCEQHTEVRYCVKITGLEEEPQVYMVMNHVRFRIELVRSGPDVYEGEAQIGLEPDFWHWIRLDVRDSRGEFAAYVNPVYSGKKEHRLKTFKEAVQYMEEEEHDQGNII